MPDIRFDTFYRYEDLTRLVQAYAQEYPGLVRVTSIGKSHEGREVWLATVTNFGSGPDAEKPGFWVDGNIHAPEVSASSACLYVLDHLVNQYGSDADVTRCLDTRVFYLCPRLNPDGAELALADRPRMIRSSTRPYPYNEEPIEGLVQEDINGDGRLLSMRIPDPNGAWKVHPEEPRLMIRREPAEAGGRYYRVLPEGRIENFDGVTIRIVPPKEGLDVNRNFPASWRQESEQPGAGPYPGSEPEVQNLLRFVTDHPNITGGVSFHTMSGVLLRPFSHQSDESLAPEDLWTYQKLGQKGTELTGYPAISIFHDFKYHPKQVITGGFGWLFEQRGAFFWAIELWSPQRRAGITDYKYIDWYREHPVEDDLKLLKWNDEALDGKGFVDWFEFEHPQLGKVELGGWDGLHAWGNPPLHLLEEEISRFPGWLVWHLLISPKLELLEASVKPLGDGAYRVRLVVCNTGWLPTYVTKRAMEKKVVRSVVCEINVPEGATLEAGKRREEPGQLEGRAYKSASRGADATDDRLKVEWVVRAPSGGAVEITARHERAGVVRVRMSLRGWEPVSKSSKGTVAIPAAPLQ